jgi:hypothetical protein
MSDEFAWRFLKWFFGLCLLAFGASFVMGIARIWAKGDRVGAVYVAVVVLVGFFIPSRWTYWMAAAWVLAAAAHYWGPSLSKF